MLRGPLIGNVGRLREATRLQTVKKQTSMNLVHNSRMTPNHVTLGRRLPALGLVLALVAAGCTTVTPPPSIGPTPTPPPTPAASLRDDGTRHSHAGCTTVDQRVHTHAPGVRRSTHAGAVRVCRPRAVDGSRCRSADRRGRRAGAAHPPARADQGRPLPDDHPGRLPELPDHDRGRGHHARVARRRGALLQAPWPARAGRGPQRAPAPAVHAGGRRLLRPGGWHLLHHPARRAVRAGRQGHHVARIHARAAGPALRSRGQPHQGSGRG